MATETQPVRMASRGGDGTYGIRGLTPTELDAFDAFLCGQQWLKVEPDAGRLVAQPLHRPLPEPTDDPVVGPHWATDREPKLVQKDFDAERLAHSMPSIIVQHLCGYGYTRERYERQARQLSSWGFECLRSRRGKEGRYWELWLLPFLEAARGPLAEVVRKAKPDGAGKAVNNVIEFLCRNASFGSLDVCVQRAAMTLE